MVQSRRRKRGRERERESARNRLREVEKELNTTAGKDRWGVDVLHIFVRSVGRYRETLIEQKG